MLPEEKRKWENQRDKKLLKRYLKGDITAFDELYAIYRHILPKGKYGTTDPEENREDALQDTFMRLLESLRNKKYLKIISLHALVTAAENRYLWHEARREHPSGLDEQLPDRKDETDNDEELELEKDLMKSLLLKAYTQLPKSEREILDCKFVKNLTAAKIAKKLKLPKPIVSKRYERIIEKLKKLVVLQNPSLFILKADGSIGYIG